MSRRLVRGAWRAGSQAVRVTIVDIARAAGVSKSTVSLVLQGSPLVKPDKREQGPAMPSGGWATSTIAVRPTCGAASPTWWGMVINDLTNPFFAEMTVGLEAALQTAGLIPFLANTGESPARQALVMRTMREHGAVGYVLCPAIGTDAADLAEVRGWGLPVTTVMRRLPGRLAEQRHAGQCRWRQARHRASAAAGASADRLSGRAVRHGGPRGASCRLGEGACAMRACPPIRHWWSRARPTATAVRWPCSACCRWRSRRPRLCASTTWSRSGSIYALDGRGLPPAATSPWSASTTSPTRA